MIFLIHSAQFVVLSIKLIIKEKAMPLTNKDKFEFKILMEKLRTIVKEAIAAQEGEAEIRLSVLQDIVAKYDQVKDEMWKS